MAQQSDRLIDHNAFHAAHFLMHGKFARLLGYYFDDTQTYLASIEAGLASNDAAQIAPAAHTIKSSSLQLGAVALSQAAAVLETDAKRLLAAGTTDLASLREQVEWLISLFTQSRKELEYLSQQRAQ